MTEGESSTPVRVAREEDGRLLRVTLDAGRGNVLTTDVMRRLRDAVEDVEPRVSTLLVDHAGKHFSYGASIPEHRRHEVRGLLVAFRELAATLLRSELVLVAAVRGRCLGGGLELASLCDRVVASPDALFGHPEIQLGVFAPLGSLLLPDLVGRRAATELLVTGRGLDASEALGIGLVSEVADDPGARAATWARELLGPLSASSLRAAVRAARLSWASQFLTRLEALETDYLERLMTTHDANEGITAFLEKRAPVWRHR